MIRNTHTLFSRIFVLCSSFILYASLAHAQNVVTKCFQPATATSVDGTGLTGDFIGAVNFASGIDFPAGHVIVDMEVEIVWSATQGSCSSPLPGSVDLSRIGFMMNPPAGLPNRWFAASAGLVGVGIGTTSTFGGNAQVLDDTVTFWDGAASSAFNNLPIPGNDFLQTNGNSLTSGGDYLGSPPGGNWSLFAIFDNPSQGDFLCIKQFCIKLYTCNPASLDAECEANVSLSVDSTGVLNVMFDDIDDGSDTSCILDVLDITPSFFTCSDIGTTTAVTMTLQDRLGNTDACVSNVTVVDNIGPVVDCKDYTVYLDNTGNFTMTGTDSIVATDNCGILPGGLDFNGSNSISFSCGQISLNVPVIITVEDNNGNITTCPQTAVNVLDTIPPTPVCVSNVDAYLNATGTISIAAADLDGGSTEACPPIVTRLINNSNAQVYDCNDIGVNNATLIVGDFWGNLDSCTTTVTVFDTIPPTANCASNYPAYVDAAGNVTVTAVELDNGSIDACTNPLIPTLVSGNTDTTFSCSDIGTLQNVPLLFEDGQNNSSTCIATVEVLDTIPPVPVCQNVTTYLDASGQATVVPVEVDNGSNDACTGTALTFQVNGAATQAYDCTAIGVPQPITLQVEDTYGNIDSCTASVTVLDTLPPIPSCVASFDAYLGSGGTVTIYPSDVDNGSTDNCGVADTSINGGATVTYSCVQAGTTQTAQLIVEDATGNIDSCAVLINVLDTLDPVAICQPYTAVLNGAGIATVTPANINGGSSDNCGITGITINSNPVSISYDCNNIGVQTAVLEVTDATGNTHTCTADVTVEDNTNPIATCSNPTIFLDGTGTATLTTADIDGGSTDNCSIVSSTINGGVTPIAYDCDSLFVLVGTLQATLEVTDIDGNTATCVSNITVRDTTSPVANCVPSITADLDASGNVNVFSSDLDGGSSDNCGITTTLINGGNIASYDCNSILTNPNIAFLLVSDASGNTAFCSSLITIQDVEDPVAVCAPQTFQLDPVSGTVTVDATDIDGGSTDNCGTGGLSYTINGFANTSQVYDCDDLGANTATLVVTDAGGNTDNCTATITIEDNTNPIAVCNSPIDIYVNNSCIATLSPADVDGGSTDNCGVTSSDLDGSPLLFLTSANLGANTVTLNVFDDQLNTASCQATVNVLDTVSPTAVCQNITVDLDGTGNVTVNAVDVDGGSFDNCGAVTLYLDAAPNTSVAYTCADIGTNTVTLIVEDGGGIQTTCTATITVEDNENPNVLCQTGVTVQLDPTGVGSISTTDIDNGSTDNCSIATMTVNPSTFGCTDVGIVPVTLVVTDVNGNVDSCTTNVTIQDNVAPTMVCQTDTVYLNTTGVGTLDAVDIDGGSSDACGIAAFAISENAGPFSGNLAYSCADVGTHTIVLQATDLNGNVNTCTQDIEVLDTISPTAICQNISVSLDITGNVIVNAADIDAGSNDNCSTIILSINSIGNTSVTYACADTGVQNVTLYVEDLGGNIDSCTATILIEDITPPTVSCLTGVNLYLDPAGTLTAVPADIDGGSSDNCTVATTTVSPSSLNCSDVGTQVLTLTVTDVSGNANTCTSTVLVQDTVSPIAVCQNDTVYLNSTGTANLVVADINGGSTDACGISSEFIDAGLGFASNHIYTCSDVGTQIVTLQITDANSNISTCTATVEVMDTLPPTLTCQPLTIQLDPTGSFVVNASDLVATSSDNCGIPTLTVNGQPSITLDCADVGTVTVTVTATDLGNNTDFCTAVITVQDNTQPTAICQPATLYLDPAGTVTALPSDIDGGSSDACGIDTMFISPTNVFDCNNVGFPNNVTLTVVDSNGISGFCNTTIIIEDTLAPTMVCLDDTLYIDNAGFIGLLPSDIDGGSTDNCALASLAIRKPSDLVFQPNLTFDCTELGVQQITLQATDINFNVDSCIANVTILDTVSPVAVCQNPYEVYLNNLGTVVVNAADPDGGSTDNCGIANYTINGFSFVQYNCSDITAPQPATITVEDFNGNTSTCTTDIVVLDTIDPNAQCQPNGLLNFNLGINSGEVIVNAIVLNNGSTDLCGISQFLINGQASNTFTCADVGVNVVELTVIDDSGNSSTCQTDIQINDVNNPNPNCNLNVTATLGPNGTVTIPASSIDNGSFDACGIVSFQVAGQDSMTYSCADIGNIIVTMTMTDPSGNFAACNSVVTVEDTTAPVAICPTTPVPVYVTATGQVVVNAIDVDAGSTDNCNIASYLVNGGPTVTYNCADIGVIQNVTLTVTDGTNQSSCPVEIEVLDTIDPTPNCQTNIIATLNGSGQAIVDAIDLDAGSTDNCSILTYLINGLTQDTFDCANGGINLTATLTVVDGSGNQADCTSQITIDDNTDPVIACASGDAYIDASGIAVVQAIDYATGTDNCQIVSWLINGQAQDTFDCTALANPQPVTITALDPSGNSATCNIQITVEDTIPPTAICNPTTVFLNTNGQVTVLPNQIGVGSDNCSVFSLQINNQPSFAYTCADVGVQTALFTVVDTEGNASVCSSDVTVVDNINPIAICQTNITAQLDVNGDVTVNAIDIDGGSTDACGPLTYTINGQAQETFNCTNIGNNPVVLQVTDANGNTATCPSIVIVEDNIAPTAICQNLTVNLDNSGNAQIIANDLNNGSFDNCQIVSVSVGAVGTTVASFTCADTGVNNLTLIVGDGVNLDSCTAQVTVVDNIAPIVTCTGTTINLTQTGPQGLTPADLNVNYTEACAIDTIILSPDTITCQDAGMVNVTVQVIDVNGNIGLCNSDVTVILNGPQPVTNSPDTLPVCEGETITLNANPPPGPTYTYQWTGPNGFTSTAQDTTVTIDAQGVNAGTYTLVITPVSGTGCPASATVEVGVNVVAPPVIGANNPICEGTDAILTILNGNTYSGDTITYDWYFNGSPLVTTTTPSYTIVGSSLSDIGGYTVNVDVDGCTDTMLVPFDLFINELPPAPQPSTDTVCEGQTLTLLANPQTNAQGTPVTGFQWSNGTTGFTSTNENPVFTAVSLADTGTYTLVVTDDSTCTATATLDVVVLPNPVQPSISANIPLCVGDILELTEGTSYTPITTYSWSLPDSTTQITSVPQLLVTNAPSGTYQLEVNMNGCLSVADTIDVNYQAEPVAFADAYSLNFRDSLLGFSVIDNDSLSLFTISTLDSVNNGKLVNNGDGTFDYTPEYSFFGVDTFTYTICDVNCPNSCDTATVVLEVNTDFECFIPNAISPNGDGINDRLNIRCVNDYPNAEFRVFSRWGNLVYEGPMDQWDGTFNGKDLPDGSYFYILKLNDTSVVAEDRFTGYIILHR
ncbi:MAG: gliding motility-associated C-terminal domain-containing protein [Saprospiraceae bacterium]|nr:gliding motility-associated C-terminal domain-containing protein [Saprospiraceae bacterium]